LWTGAACVFVNYRIDVGSRPRWDVGAALGTQAGEAKLREVITAGDFRDVRRATETPFFNAASVDSAAEDILGRLLQETRT
jgi:hypothetical protein